MEQTEMQDTVTRLSEIYRQVIISHQVTSLDGETVIEWIVALPLIHKYGYSTKSLVDAIKSILPEFP